MKNIAIATLWLVGGVILGYATLAAGPIPAAVALVMLVVLLVKRRSMPEQAGGYLAGLGLSGAIVLLHVITTCSQPSCQFDPSTVPALVVCLLIVGFGVWFLIQAMQRQRFAPKRSAS
jgi:chromate transport protein ChrA